jgi:hypothetical protein
MWKEKNSVVQRRLGPFIRSSARGTMRHGSPSYFKDKVIVDCASGSGMHTKWMSEYGAKHVIALELSNSVDGIMRENLRGLDHVDVIQCSIDAPPIRPGSINGLVICNAAIQHTPPSNAPPMHSGVSSAQAASYPLAAI